MRAISISMLTVLVQSAVLSLAIPIVSSLTLRNDFASLAPHILTRYVHDRRATPIPGSPSVHPRDYRETSRCVPGTETCVTLSIGPPEKPSTQRSLFSLLSQAIIAVHYHIEAHGDGDVPSGEAKWAGNDGVALRVTNTNNHQLTWGVLGVALQGVTSMMGNGAFGRASFVIFDGPNLVGSGVMYA